LQANGELTAAIYAGVLIPQLVHPRLADFLDGRGDNWCRVLRVTKLQVHTSANIAPLQHGTSPRRTRNCDLGWLGAKLGMSRDERFVVTQKDYQVTVMLGLNLEHSRGRQIVKRDAPFNFRLRNVVIHFIAEVGMRAE
jgi:hypothetical protein